MEITSERLEQLHRLEMSLNYRFKDISLLQAALVHTSLCNENRNIAESNERMEFLGDSVLALVTSTYLYTNYSQPEGVLSKVRAASVSAISLGEVADRLKLSEYELLGRGEEADGGRTKLSIKANMTEACIAAIFLDGGMEPARKFILDNLTATIKQVMDGEKFRDYKTELQELVQSVSQKPLVYTIVGESGPAHDKHFVAEVSHRDKVLGTGEGRGKKDAEREAAKNAVAYWLEKQGGR